MGPKKGGRGMTFQSAELNALLTILEERLPIGADQWENLAMEYNRGVSNSRHL
jgi:hypothetical protein